MYTIYIYIYIPFYLSRKDDVQLAVINSGGIRASFDRGKITMGDLLNSFPFRNTFGRLTVHF